MDPVKRNGGHPALPARQPEEAGAGAGAAQGGRRSIEAAGEEGAALKKGTNRRKLNQQPNDGKEPEEPAQPNHGKENGTPNRIPQDQALKEAMKTKQMYNRIAGEASTTMNCALHSETWDWSKGSKVVAMLQRHSADLEKALTPFSRTFLTMKPEMVKKSYTPEDIKKNLYSFNSVGPGLLKAVESQTKKLNDMHARQSQDDD